MDTKFKINVTSGDISFEGSEEFVEGCINKLGSIIELLNVEAKASTIIEDIPNSTTLKTTSEQPKEIVIEDIKNYVSFDEFRNLYIDKVKDTQLVLIAGKFLQDMSSDKMFKTNEITKLLKEYGIVLTNASSSLKRARENKSLIQAKKDGKLIFYRVSRDGLSKLEELKK